MDVPAAPALPPTLAAALLAAGYRLRGPVGVGSEGPVWTASPVGGTAPGPDRVVVQVVRVADAGVAERVLRRLEALWTLRHPHLPEVVDVVVGPAGAPGEAETWGVLLAEVPGATLAALLAARGRLSVGEVVTLTVPLAGALDGLHRCGLVHGDVSPANVVVRPDGRPVLIDVLGGLVTGGDATPGFAAPEVGRPRPGVDDGAEDPAQVRGGADGGGTLDGRVDGGALPAGAPADVFGLASVALAALDLAAHEGRLGAELRAACSGDPVRRPPAAELAAALYACADPEPIAQPDAGVLARTELAQLAAPSRTVSVPTGGRHRVRRRRAGRRRWAVGLATVLAVCGAGWLTVDGPGPERSAGSHRSAAATPSALVAAGVIDPSPSAIDPSPGVIDPATDRADPVGAAVALTRRRAEVLASGDPGRVAEVARPGSPAFDADRALLDRLAASGVRVDGLAAVVGEASGVSSTSGPPAAAGRQDAVDVRVRAGITAHARRSPTGVTDVPAQAPRAVVLRLVWGPDGWRVVEVLPG